MNVYCFFLLPIIFYKCSNVQIDDQKKQSGTEKIENYRIDTIIIKQIELKHICFVIEESNVPEINGIGDVFFSKQINDNFVNNFNTFLEKAKHIFGTHPDSYKDDSYIGWSIPATARGSFEILSANDSIISIVQYFIALPGGGANGWEPTSATLNIDVKNRRILNNNDLNMNYRKENLLNIRIMKFLDKEYPDEALNNEIDYPYITDKKQIDNLSFGIRNDSIILVIEAYPTAHYSYTTYIIPIQLWDRK